MSPGSGSLLRALAGGVHPVDTPASVGPASPPDRETLDFGLALAHAREGELRTGLPVAVPPALRAGIDRATGDSISDATDRAAAMGIDRALVILGDRAFRVDIGARAIIDAPNGGPAITGIDGVVRVPSPGGSNPTAGPDRPGHTNDPHHPTMPNATGPARVVRNTSLLNTLAGPGLG